MRAVVAAGLLLTGCFYVDPIVARPVVKIKVVTPSVITRGDMVKLEASFDEGDASRGTYDWNIYACERYNQTDGPDGCDDQAFYTASGADRAIEFSVLVTTKGARPTNGISVRLEARSDRGAVARNGGQSGFAVGDAPPLLDLDRSARSFSVGAPIDLFAAYGDVDDAPGDVQLEWTPTPPPGGAFTIEDLPVPVAPGTPELGRRTVGKRLIPGAPGAWDVKVTASDPTQRDPRAPIKPPAVEKHLVFTVAPDRPPCLAQWQPIAPPAGQTLPITAPTVFQVPLVDDDLDAYPPVLDAPQFGAATFAWSILPPGAAQRQVLLDAHGNRIDLDPAAFTPGDIVELRVEVFDRHPAVLPCADADPTCSITGAPGCIQRQTWRVEVR